MSVFIAPIYDELKAQIWYLVRVAVTLLFCTTKCRQGALDKVVTFASEVLIETEPPDCNKPEATLGDRIDLCIS